MMTQHVVQHRQRMPARIVALAGIDPERTLDLEIMEAAPSGICREIVGVEGDQRIGPVVIDAAERALIVAFEHHHQIRPPPPLRPSSMDKVELKFCSTASVE